MTTITELKLMQGNGEPPKERTPPQVRVSIGSDNELNRPAESQTSWYKKMREMRRDPTIALARMLSIAPVLASTWSVEKEKNAPAGADELVMSCMMPARLDLMRTAMFGCIDYGWQPYEMVNKLDAHNNLVLKRLKPLLQDMTDIVVSKETGDYLGLRQDPAPLHLDEAREVYLDATETLLVYIDVEGTNWYGDPLMKTAEGPYDLSHEVNKSASRYDRKIAGAHWVIYYPIGTSRINGVDTDNYNVAVTLLSTLEASGSIAIPRTVSEVLDTVSAQQAEMGQWKIELMSAEGSTSSSFIDRLKYLDALKVRAFGLPERSVLEGQFGTKAEAEAHADFAITNMDLRHRIVVQLVNKHVVNRLLRLNYGEEAEGSVYIQPSPIVDTAMMLLRDVYKTILANPQQGMMEIASIDMEAMRDRLGVPMLPMTEGDEVVGDVSVMKQAIKIAVQGGSPLMGDVNALKQMIVDSQRMLA